MDEQLISKLINLGLPSTMRDAFTLIKALEVEDAVEVDGEIIKDKEKFKEAHGFSKDLREKAIRQASLSPNMEYVAILKNALSFDAPHDFDAFCMRLEWYRPKEKKFYMPRRKQLKPIAKELQRLADGKLDVLGISLPPGVGKSTLALFFLAWIGSKEPNLTTLCGSHSNSFLEGMYGELARILGIGSDEYCWKEIFDVPIVGKNAKNLRIDLGTKKRFETFEFSSIGSGNAGKVRASNLLYCDDLVSDIEQAMSKDRMEKLWQQYYVDLRQRKIGTAKELHIATRWSIYDPIGRLESEYENDPRAKFVKVPALNEDDESNFDYPYNLGFTTKFYRSQRDIMDEASWKALYMNEPIEREGLLVDREKLRRFFDLPDREPDAIIGVCDTKTTGPDYCALPLAYVYGNEYYIKAVLFENYAPDIVEANLVNFLVKENPQMVQFESNVAGGKLAQNIQAKIREKSCRTKLTTKWTQANKETKIIVNMPWVLEHCLFLDESMLKGPSYSEYRGFLNQLCSYSMNDNHKKKHDDAPDSMAQLAEFVNSMHSGKASVAKRFF